MVVWGWITLLLTVICMLFLFGKEADVIGIGGAIIMGVQLVPLIGFIFPTEKVWRNNFDKDGHKL